MNQPGAHIVITGMGLVTCLGLDARSTWQGVLERRSGIGPLTALDSVAPGTAPNEVPWRGGQAPCAARADVESREVRLLRMALDEAWNDAGFGEKPPYSPYRCGYALGTTLHGMRRAGVYFRSGDPRPLADFLAGAMLRIATHGMYPRGPMLTTCAACASGLGSIGLAMTLLRAGVLDLVIAGGYDTISEYAYAGFSSLRLIGAGPSRPFCKGRDGMMIAEGYAVVVLERAGDALARGAAPRAWVRGIGESSDCHHLTQPHPEGEGAVRAIRAALATAGVGAEQIGLISAHATGTPNNDAAEAAALGAALGTRLSEVPAVAFKTHIGHTLGAAGAAELVLCAAALRDQVAPPTANISPEDIEFPAIGLNTDGPRRARFDSTLNLSLGFGGANACAILGSAADMSRLKEPPRDVPLREVFITGIGVILPGAVGNKEFAALLGASSGEIGAPRRAGPIGEESYIHLINARRTRRMSEYVKLTLGATSLAFADAGVTDPAAFGAGSSAILGTTHGSTAFSEAYYSQIVREGIASANPTLFAEGVPNGAAAQLSMAFQIKGLCQTIIGTRTAGLDALWLAALRIATGEWERAVVSAAEEFSPLLESAYGCHGLYSTDGAGPPFGSGRGFVSGTGAVTFILESQSAVEARDARPRGRVLTGISLSAARLAARGLAGCVRRCLESIGSPADILSSANGTWIDHVEASGVAGSRRGKEPAAVSSIYGHIPETFSVGPLAGIAAVLLGGADGGAGTLPALLSDWRGIRGLALPAPARKPVSEFGVLCCDYAGIVSAVGVQCLRA